MSNEKKKKNEWVMSAGKDPFNLTVGRKKNAEWVTEKFNSIIIPHLEANNLTAIHNRDIHYILQGLSFTKPNGDPYINDANSWNFLCYAIRDARYLGIFPYEMIIDKKNEAKILIKYRDHYNMETLIEWVKEDLTFEGFLNNAISNFSEIFNRSLFQKYHVEFWTEKSLPILDQIASKYSIITNIVEGEGEISLTQIIDLIKRSNVLKKPVRIGYLGDFDVVGMNLARAFSRKLEFYCRKNPELDIKVKRIMLIPSQVRENNLPLNPMKVSDNKGYETRKEKFYTKHGLRGAVELNTLHAQHSEVFRSLVHSFVSRYYDDECVKSTNSMQNSIKDKVREILQEEIEEFDVSEIDFSDLDELYKPEEIEYTKEVIEEDDEWIFDSNRSAEDQFRAYGEI